DTTHLFLRSPLHKGRAGPRPEATDPPMSVTDHRSPHPLSVRGTTAKHCDKVRRRRSPPPQTAWATAGMRISDPSDCALGHTVLIAGPARASGPYEGSEPHDDDRMTTARSDEPLHQR